MAVIDHTLEGTLFWLQHGAAVRRNEGRMMSIRNWLHNEAIKLRYERQDIDLEPFLELINEFDRVTNERRMDGSFKRYTVARIVLSSATQSLMDIRDGI